MDIRDATERDLSSIVAIYNDVVATSTAIYRDDPIPLDEYHASWRTRTAQG